MRKALYLGNVGSILIYNMIYKILVLEDLLKSSARI